MIGHVRTVARNDQIKHAPRRFLADTVWPKGSVGASMMVRSVKIAWASFVAVRTTRCEYTQLDCERFDSSFGAPLIRAVGR